MLRRVPRTTLCVSFGTLGGYQRYLGAASSPDRVALQLLIFTGVNESKTACFPYMKLEGRRGNRIACNLHGCR